jgi:hypothetical protein
MANKKIFREMPVLVPASAGCGSLGGTRRNMMFRGICGKSKAILAFMYLAALGTSVFAAGSSQRGSGQYKQFTYQDGTITRNARAEYAGYYLKEFSIAAGGVFVVKGNFCPWNGEYSGWENLFEEEIPYGDFLDPRDVLEGAAEGSLPINVTKTNGSTFILEAAPDKDGDYWWWTTNGTVQFFQNVYVVR